MIEMFREHGMGNFQHLLMKLSTFPGMMYYLDNTESHKVALNENYGRELLELFSLGVGKDEAFNYAEDDVKACARAFTGWNVNRDRRVGDRHEPHMVWARADLVELRPHRRVLKLK